MQTRPNKNSERRWGWQLSQALSLGEKQINILREVEGFHYLAAARYVPRPQGACVDEEVSAPAKQPKWKIRATGGVEIVNVPSDQPSLSDPLQWRLTHNITQKHDQ